MTCDNQDEKVIAGVRRKHICTEEGIAEERREQICAKEACKNALCFTMINFVYENVRDEEPIWICFNEFCAEVKYNIIVVGARAISRKRCLM